MSIVSISSTVDLGQAGDPIHSGADAVDSGADGAGVVGGVAGFVVAGALIG